METITFSLLVLIALTSLLFFVWEWREKRRHHFTVGDVSEVPVGAHFCVLDAEDVWYRKQGPQAFDCVHRNRLAYTLIYEPVPDQPIGQVRWTRSALLTKRWMLEDSSDLPAWSERDKHTGSLVMIGAGLVFLAVVFSLAVL